MEPKNRTILIQRIRAKFRGYESRDENILFFEQWSSAITETVLSQIGLCDEIEEKLVLHYCGESVWVLLTEKRLVWNRHGKIGALPLCEIALVTAPGRGLDKTCDLPLVKLFVLDRNKILHEILMGPRNPVFAFLNILMMVPSFFQYDKQLDHRKYRELLDKMVKNEYADRVEQYYLQHKKSCESRNLEKESGK